MQERLSAGKVAVLFGVTIKTVHTWERKSRFPASIRLPSGHRRYWTTEIVAELRKYGMVVPEELGGVPDAVPPIEDGGAMKAKIMDVEGDDCMVYWGREGAGEEVVFLDLPKGMAGLDLAGIAALRHALDRAEAAYRGRAK